MEIKELTSEQFDEHVLKSGKTVLVDFYASWCGPCKMQSAVLDGYVKEAKDIEIVKINIDTEREVAGRYNVSSIPTLMVVKNGEVVKIEPGFKTKSQLEEFVNV